MDGKKETTGVEEAGEHSGKQKKASGKILQRNCLIYNKLS